MTAAVIALRQPLPVRGDIVTVLSSDGNPIGPAVVQCIVCRHEGEPLVGVSMGGVRHFVRASRVRRGR
ncbi:MAG: hypothetical protein ACREDY_20405 [Bradyrhizobium sp.]